MISAVASTLPLVTVSVVVPGETGVTKPLVDTVATSGVSDIHDTPVSTSGSPSVNVPIALI